MSENGKDSSLTRTEAEDRFLAECLLAFDPAQGKINMTAVAQAMGYKNVGSAVNKFAQFKKKFNFDIRTFHENEGKSKRLGANEPASPKKATPKRTPRKKKAAPSPKESDQSEEDGDKLMETGSPSA